MKKTRLWRYTNTEKCDFFELEDVNKYPNMVNLKIMFQQNKKNSLKRLAYIAYATDWCAHYDVFLILIQKPITIFEVIVGCLNILNSYFGDNLEE